MSKEEVLSGFAVIIPSLNPDGRFTKIVNDLMQEGFRHIVIVDDGSDEAHQHFFTEAAELPVCSVLHHGVNKGKGRGLKTAFEYVLKELPDLHGVITADGDGQHLPKDIIACGERMLEDEKKVVLGCRNFRLPGIPPRNRYGNRFTSAMFLVCCGIRLSDTQTGLRAIPTEYLQQFCEIDGERFEYETNMLLTMKRTGIAFVEQPIETVYDPNDYSTHYNPVKDSLRIFGVIFKFILSSLGATLVDLIIFTVAFALLKGKTGAYTELLSTVIARVISSFVNFNANKKIVFRNEGSYGKAMLRYYCLCIPQMLISAGLVSLLNHLLNNSVPILATLIKAVVDTILFFISFGIQREWVFAKEKKNKK